MWLELIFLCNDLWLSLNQRFCPFLFLPLSFSVGRLSAIVITARDTYKQAERTSPSSAHLKGRKQEGGIAAVWKERIEGKVKRDERMECRRRRKSELWSERRSRGGERAKECSCELRKVNSEKSRVPERERLVLKKETKERGNRERGRERERRGRGREAMGSSRIFFRSCFQCAAWHGRHKLLQVTFFQD